MPLCRLQFYSPIPYIKYTRQSFLSLLANWLLYFLLRFDFIIFDAIHRSRKLGIHFIECSDWICRPFCAAKSQVYIPKRRTLIQVLPRPNFGYTQTNGQADKRTLPIPLSPCFVIDKYIWTGNKRCVRNDWRKYLNKCTPFGYVSQWNTYNNWRLIHVILFLLQVCKDLDVHFKRSANYFHPIFMLSIGHWPWPFHVNSAQFWLGLIGLDQHCSVIYRVLRRVHENFCAFLLIRIYLYYWLFLNYSNQLLSVLYFVELFYDACHNE